MDYQKLLKWRNENNAFARMLDMRITEISEGYAKAEIAVSEKHRNPVDSVHGGCLFTLLDAAGSAAASSYGSHVTTLDANIHYLRAGLHTTHLTAATREIKRGKKVMVYDISVTDQDGQLLAEGMFTYMSLGKEIIFET